MLRITIERDGEVVETVEANSLVLLAEDQDGELVTAFDGPLMWLSLAAHIIDAVVTGHLRDLVAVEPYTGAEGTGGDE
jgi:hypothetical protein